MVLRRMILVLHAQEQLCRVFRDASDGRYWIEVLCGGIGQFEVSVPMLEPEVAAFLADPRSIADVVRTVCDRPAAIVKERRGWLGDITSR